MACRKVIMICFVMLKALSTLAQPGSDLDPLLTTPLNYTTYKVLESPVVDGNIDDAAWQNAEWTSYFVDIEGEKKSVPSFNTRVKMVWDNSCLYIAAALDDPHVWATLKHHDEIIYHDNDFEVFLDPENSVQQYYELEVNAFNTILDLFLPKPYRNGGLALINWDLNHLRSAVQVRGTLNDPSDTDQG